MEESIWREGGGGEATVDLVQSAESEERRWTRCVFFRSSSHSHGFSRWRGKAQFLGIASAWSFWLEIRVVRDWDTRGVGASRGLGVPLRIHF